MSWKWNYAALILGSTMVDFVAGRQIEISQSKRKRKAWLIFSVVFNVGVLFLFKYFGLFAEIGNAFMAMADAEVRFNAIDLLLPVGISFYTFQTMSYTIDVYRGEKKAEQHFGHFALFVCFFPQLIAGPIERAGKLLPKLKANSIGSASDIDIGLRLIIWGLFKKVVLADRLAFFVDAIYADPSFYSRPEQIFAFVCFSFQLYFDFSAYSDMAVGSARLFGIELSQNFKNPLFAPSFREFWKRWHITLSTWFRDYLYIPLGGNKRNTYFWLRNIILTFLISGLWHGANLTFAVWGLLHGAFLLLERGIQRMSIRMRVRFVQGLLVFAAWTFSLIFFRAENLNEAMVLIGIKGESYSWQFSLFQTFISERLDLVLLLLLIPLSFLIEYRFMQYPLILPKQKSILVTAALAMLLIMILFFPFPSQPFVYFQF